MVIIDSQIVIKPGQKNNKKTPFKVCRIDFLLYVCNVETRRGA